MECLALAAVSFRTCGALLLLLSACATTEPQQHKARQHKQVAIPWAPLVEPEPIVLPAPVGLRPPVPAFVDPRVQTQQELEPSPSPERSGSNRGPTVPLTSERRRPECEAVPVPHRGGDDAHDDCADRFPPNQYPGKDVLVNRKRFDALQVGVPVLWEIKTDRFDKYNDFVQEQAIRTEVPDLQEERDIAEACGYGFVIGVSTEAHKEALLQEDRRLNIVVTGCPR